MSGEKRRADNGSDTEEQSTITTVDARPKGSKLVSKQRSQVEYLMKNIDKPIDISTPEKPMLRPPPDIVLNVRGSSAGAGSSDFSIYRDLRRKENLRVKLMESDAAQDSAKDKFIDEIELLKQKDEEKTAKNRAKRQKRKNKNKSVKEK
ncbi:hypothetical protein LPJ62_004134 [Coemansia sp. RSA 2167]|nr:hypothetical protein LPJ62_004134 [Coemansia sp. RSA 2167]KAJ2203501.1 hypothetical protein IW145_004029 [Coemansia sp. RSA 521]KAJ2219324.1 hypothetical protein IW143_002731 [Coemansia sp. RSA 520]KAJ2227323.1 hypothetical protein EV180_002500 [Coemansia sp. RSA 518]KAJ2238558.1 hypothetical protein GGH97_005366 [Coemansia sp. RSA 475]KAJ2291397.1 hypothetical protein IW141_002691 [Coemansia sp. RSA 355]KAJ2535891.1 hypothetical protein IWW43_001290 [Coemansia sp. RSA 1935]KAJ2587849.1 h